MASLWTFGAWILAHAVAILAGVCVASTLCSALLALWLYSLRRQQKKTAQYHKTGMEALLTRVQALDDRIAIVALTAAQISPSGAGEKTPETFAIAAVPHQRGRPADEARCAIREEINEMLLQLREQGDLDQGASKDLETTASPDENTPGVPSTEHAGNT